VMDAVSQPQRPLSTGGRTAPTSAFEMTFATD
jgi:hypothetical protein